MATAILAPAHYLSGAVMEHSVAASRTGADLRRLIAILHLVLGGAVTAFASYGFTALNDDDITGSSEVAPIMALPGALGAAVAAARFNTAICRTSALVAVYFLIGTMAALLPLRATRRSWRETLMDYCLGVPKAWLAALKSLQ